MDSYERSDTTERVRTVRESENTRASYPSSRVTHHSNLHPTVTRALVTSAIAVVAGNANLVP